jgi:hypothetical protein
VAEFIAATKCFVADVVHDETTEAGANEISYD